MAAVCGETAAGRLFLMANAALHVTGATRCGEVRPGFSATCGGIPAAFSGQLEILPVGTLHTKLEMQPAETVARRNAAEAGATNVEFRKGRMESTRSPTHRSTS